MGTLGRRLSWGGTPILWGPRPCGDPGQAAELGRAPDPVGPTSILGTLGRRLSWGGPPISQGPHPSWDPGLSSGQHSGHPGHDGSMMAGEGQELRPSRCSAMTQAPAPLQGGGNQVGPTARSSLCPGKGTSGHQAPPGPRPLALALGAVGEVGGAALARGWGCLSPSGHFLWVCLFPAAPPTGRPRRPLASRCPCWVGQHPSTQAGVPVSPRPPGITLPGAEAVGSAGAELSVPRGWRRRTHVPSAICWPGAEPPHEG